jgi:hypothetical protein
MSLKLQFVDTNYVQQIWPYVESYIQDSVDQTPTDTYNIEHVKAFLANGQWLLLVAVDDNNAVHGAATVSFSNYPNHRVAFITNTGGRMVANPELFEQLKQIAKQYGATKVQAYCRESMVRLLGKCGFEPLTTLVEVTL